MDTAASSSTHIRRLMPLILWSLGGMSLLGIVAVVLWIWLPRWAPELVIKHSPWVDPVLRAVANESSDKEVNPLVGMFERFESWGESATPTLVSGLDSRDDRYRMVAVAAFDREGTIPASFRYSVAVCEKISRLAVTDDHIGVRVHAFLTLTNERSSRMSEIRSEGMKDPDERVRRAVVFGIDSRFSELDWKTLLLALSDSDASVRYYAIQRTSDLGETRAIPRLMEMAREEKNGNFRPVLWALGRLNATDSIPLLKELLKDRRTNYHAEMLFRVLAAIDPAEGFRAKVEALRSDNAALRAFAAEELGTAGDPQAITPLVRKLQDPEPHVVGYVISALVQLKATVAMEVMVESLEANWGALSELEEQQLSGSPDVGTPIISGRFIRVHVNDLLDQVGTMPLTPPLRERLERLRQE